jgi:hypothetical protein
VVPRFRARRSRRAAPPALRAVAALFVRGWLGVRGSVRCCRWSSGRHPRGCSVSSCLEKGIYEVHYELEQPTRLVDILLEGLREIVSHRR